jgi:hypothetical protein
MSKSRKSIFIDVKSASVFWGYIVVEFGVVICSQVFIYVDLSRQFDDNIAMLVNKEFRLLCYSKSRIAPSSDKRFLVLEHQGDPSSTRV